MWPMQLDMTRDECRGVLRRLELESYAAIVSVFRAQGVLCKEKSRILDDLRRVLHISQDRHKAEARRVANDERLTTVAELVSGPNSGQEWCREGRRLFPILPRMVPYTALSYIANSVYEQLTRENSKLPHPFQTACDRLREKECQHVVDGTREIKLEVTDDDVQEPVVNGIDGPQCSIVGSDPMVDMFNKNHIPNDMKRSFPTELKACDSTDDESTVKRKGQPLEDHPFYQSQDTNSIDSPLHSPNSTISNNSGNHKQQLHPPKSTERSKKLSARKSKGKAQLTSTKAAKQNVPNQSKSTKGSSRHSPHLIHSYAVPYNASYGPESEPYVGPQSESQLQQHLVSNVTYNSQYDSMFVCGYQIADPFMAQPGALIPKFGPHQILPSSKKDIQYNLKRLNPINTASVQNSASVPPKSPTQPKVKPPVHPILNYQKKSPSKNVLIPTSSAAATLACLGLPKQLNRKDNSPIVASNKSKESEVAANQHDIPNPKIVFSTSPTLAPVPVDESTCVTGKPSPSPGSKITILDQIITLPPALASSSIGSTNVQPMKSPIVTPQVTPVTTPVKLFPAAALQSPTTPTTVTTGSASKIILRPTTNLPGFTAVKGGTKLSVSKMQLLPLGTPTTKVKSNVLVLPKTTVSPHTGGTLNPGQKISIPKSIVETTAASNMRSPAKVIVQQQPDLNNVVFLDLCQEQKQKSAAKRSLPADEASIDILSIAPVKAANLPKSTGSPLTDRIIKPVTSTANAVNQRTTTLTTATKYEADSTAGKLIKLKHNQTTVTGTIMPTAIPIKPPVITSSLVKRLKLTPVASSSISSTATEPPTSSTGGIVIAHASNGNSISTTDWELELDQANAVPKSNHVGSAQKSTGNVRTVGTVTSTGVLRGPITLAKVSNASQQQQQPQPQQPLSSSSISSTSSNAVSPLGDQPSPGKRLNTLVSLSNAVEHAIAPPTLERHDDTSATDSAEAEDDPDDDPAPGPDEYIEEHDEDDEEVGEEEEPEDEDDDELQSEEQIIIEEHNFDALIAEDPDDEHFTESLDDERVEIVNVGYDSQALITELEGDNTNTTGEGYNHHLDGGYSSHIVYATHITNGDELNGTEQRLSESDDELTVLQNRTIVETIGLVRKSFNRTISIERQSPMVQLDHRKQPPRPGSSAVQCVLEI